MRRLAIVGLITIHDPLKLLSTLNLKIYIKVRAASRIATPLLALCAELPLYIRLNIGILFGIIYRISKNYFLSIKSHGYEFFQI